MRIFSYIFASVLLIVSVLDIASTNTGLAVGAVEVNPVMSFFQDVFGGYWYIPKMVLIGCAIYIMILHPSTPVFVAMSVVILYTCVIVYGNFSLAGVI